jgi:hypothetical protein
MRPLRFPHRACIALLALVASASLQAEELRLRALLVAPGAESDTSMVDLGLHGEARVIVHPDGQARLDLVSWALPTGPVEAALRFDARTDVAPLLVVPLERDADEGRVIGASFRLDADAARRLRSGEGQVLLTSSQRPEVAILGALRMHPRRAEAGDAPLHAAD